MRHWKEAGQPNSPIGDVIQWNCPFPGIVKAVSGCDCLSSFIFQNPEVRSNVEKIRELAMLISLMHLVISFMECLSMWEFWFSSQRSCTILSPCPCFFGMQKIGELYRESHLHATPQFQPFFQGLLNKLVVHFWNLVLFPINWICIFQVNFVLVVLG
jgi:hypothetical protein